MRGKGCCTHRGRSEFGITPAYAGKRPPFGMRSQTRGDHPRVCGEKDGSAVITYDKVGSPPRMRGKEEIHCNYAFEPGDHPRVCGEKCRELTASTAG